MAFVLLGGVLAASGVMPRVGGAGAPRFPDLVAKPPTDLFFSREVLDDGLPHHLLRFTTIAWNPGEGRLELEGNINPSNRLASSSLFQNLYDAETGGRLVQQIPVGSNLVYHPNHYHYHLDGFAAYLLLKKAPDGSFQTTRHAGAKMSSCVLDSVRVTRVGPSKAGYRGCEQTRQGMSVGWGDSYHAALPEQWIDLGAHPLPDGEYAIRYTVDPAGRIAEGGREANNVATTPFAVRQGRIVDLPEPARCTLDDPSGAVGAATTLTCAHFARGERIDVYWEGRDAWGVIPSEPIASFQSARDLGVPTSTRLTFPAAPGGSHNLVVQGAKSQRIAVVIIGVAPALALAPDQGLSGGPLALALSGFGPRETVALTWDRAPDAAPPTRVTVSETGTATVHVPATGLPAARLLAAGERSGLTAELLVAS